MIIGFINRIVCRIRRFDVLKKESLTSSSLALDDGQKKVEREKEGLRKKKREIDDSNSATSVAHATRLETQDYRFLQPTTLLQFLRKTLIHAFAYPDANVNSQRP